MSRYKHSRLFRGLAITAVASVLSACAYAYCLRTQPSTDSGELDSMPVATLPTAVVSKRAVPNQLSDVPVEEIAAPGWPNLFGPNHDGKSSEVGLIKEWSTDGPPELWRQPVGKGYSSPVVAGDDLIVLERRDDQERVVCRHALTGALRWEFAYPTTYQCRYQYSDGPYSTPIIATNHVYTLGAEGQLHCLDRGTGTLVWRRLLKDDYQFGEGLFAVGSSPLLDDRCLIINIGGTVNDSGIVAIEAETGQTRWTATADRAGYATPRAATIHGRRYVFVFTADGLVSLDPHSGHVWWSIPFCSKAPDTVNASSPVVEGDSVMVSMGPGPGSLCLRVLPDGSYEEVWRDRRVLDSTWSNLIGLDGYVFGFSSKRMSVSFRCVELATGKLRWKWSSEIERGAALAVDDRVILWGEDGHLALLDLDTTQPVVRGLTEQPLLEGPCYSSPALQQGLLYLRNEKWLICLDLRAQVGDRTARTNASIGAKTSE